jgi:hypothetical protein
MEKFLNYSSHHSRHIHQSLQSNGSTKRAKKMGGKKMQRIESLHSTDDEEDDDAASDISPLPTSSPMKANSQ